MTEAATNQNIFPAFVPMPYSLLCFLPQNVSTVDQSLLLHTKERISNEDKMLHINFVTDTCVKVWPNNTTCLIQIYSFRHLAVENWVKTEFLLNKRSCGIVCFPWWFVHNLSKKLNHSVSWTVKLFTINSTFIEGTLLVFCWTYRNVCTLGRKNYFLLSLLSHRFSTGKNEQFSDPFLLT